MIATGGEGEEGEKVNLEDLPSQGIEPGPPVRKARALTTTPRRIDRNFKKYFITYIM